MANVAAKGPVQATNFVAVLQDSPSQISPEGVQAAFGSSGRSIVLASADRRLIACIVLRRNETGGGGSDSQGRIRAILGDASEFNPEQPEEPMANGALLEFNLASATVSVLASIIGLPPIFLHESPDFRILGSDLFCLSQLMPGGLRFDGEGVMDLCSYGFPVGQRTLFRDIGLVAGGVSLKFKPDAEVESKQVFQFRRPDPLPNWNDYTELQIEGFLKALGRMEVKDSFLSLTAGLDTRAVFSALVSTQRTTPAYTLSGETPSLDAKTARALCKACGVPHEIVALDDKFVGSLADYAVTAARLSGGLASLGQAHQVHLYRELGRPFAGRISGNMGNQLGRKGVEHVSMRAADPSVLNAELQRRIALRPKYAWANQNDAAGKPEMSHEFLFQREFVFTQLGNYCLGNAFAVQQSPYASRDLISMCYREPMRDVANQASTPLQLRLNDLRHRFLGEPEVYSFQRRLIHQLGGVCASYPINWGWRARGGVSLPGILNGLRAAADAYSERSGWDSGVPGRALRLLGITGLHEHRKPKRWLRYSLRAFANDTLRSKAAAECGVLDSAAVNRMLEEHYTDRASHHRALVLALDLALAARNFSASL